MNDNKEFDKYICEKYPNLFREKNLPMSQTCMCWGIDCDKGWNSLIEEAMDSLNFLEKTTGLEFVIKQVKEKFGQLTIYYVPYDNGNCSLSPEEKTICHNIANSIISNAQNKSSNMCEKCGNYAETLRHNGWIYTVCDEHKEKIIS